VSDGKQKTTTTAAAAAAAPATTTPPKTPPATTTNPTPLQPHRRNKTAIGPWKLGRTLGQGASGKVKEARHVATGEVVAVKIVRKEKGRSEGGAWEVPGGVEREVVVMMVLGGLELEKEGKEGKEGKERGKGGKGQGGRGKLVGLRDVFENGWEV